MKIYFLFVFLILLNCCQAFAQQIIHIENKHLAHKENGFSGNAEFSANFVQNINNIFQSVNSFQVKYKKEKKT
ncbi:MAG: hypothetical protein M3Q58_17265 [Bacteroidota bacterium]|nr:hypothetical protein [Bacteroidota bacterium]